MTTIETNRLIAEFMGFEFVTVNFFGTSDETDWQKINAEWMDKVGMDSVGDYIVNIHLDRFHEWDEVAYHSSWDWLIHVWAKLQHIGADRGTVHERFWNKFHNGIDYGDINKCYQAVVDELLFLKS